MFRKTPPARPAKGLFRKFSDHMKTSIAARFTFAMASLTAFVLFVLMVSSLCFIYILVRQNVQRDLELHAMLTKQKIETILNGIQDDISSLSSNLLIANALADSRGREIYLDPFLKSYRSRDNIPIRITLCDFTGAPLQTNRSGALKGYSDPGIVRHVIGKGEPYAAVHLAANIHVLFVAYPVIFPATNQPEGMLVAEVIVKDVFSNYSEQTRDRFYGSMTIFSGNNQVWSTTGDQKETQFSNVSLLKLHSPLERLAMRIELRDYRKIPVEKIIAIYLVIGVGLLALSVRLSRTLSHRLTARIETLNRTARMIAEKGELQYISDVGDSDEVGGLAASFNSMVNRLSEYQANLERKVDERTQELIRLNESLQKEIVERRVIGRTLTERERRLHAIVQTTVDAIITIDQKGFIESFNPAAEKIFGYNSTEVIGSNVQMLMPEPYRTEHPRYIENYLGTGQRKMIGLRREALARRKDGTVFPIELSLSEVVLGDRILFTGIIRDIAERLKSQDDLIAAKEAAEAATRAKSEFLASMSHEIRTPMNSILGMAELLTETPLNPEQKQYVSVFRKAGENLLSIINDILDFSRVESGQISLESIPFMLDESIHAVIEIMRVRAESRNLRLVSIIEPGTPVNLTGDPVRLRQVLINLLGNAIKFTEDGSITLTVGRTTGIPEDGRIGILFSVADTGIGIDPDKQEIIFDTFTQADSSISRRFGGTGLGLSISKKLVALMGGTLSVKSSPGEGSTFFFTAFFLPPAGHRELPDRNRAVPEQVPRSSDGSKEKQLHILLVEDNMDNRILILSFLGKTPHEIDVAENGELALRKVMGGQPYDLILMDVQMPVMDGYTATRKIRDWEHETNASQTPIVALTANALDEDIRQSIRAGCSGHLTKPVRKKDLLDFIRSYAVL